MPQRLFPCFRWCSAFRYSVSVEVPTVVPHEALMLHGAPQETSKKAWFYWRCVLKPFCYMALFRVTFVFLDYQSYFP